MKKEYFFTSIFFAVVVLSFYLFYRLLLPFLIPICWAAIFAITFYPMYNKMERRIRKSARFHNDRADSDPDYRPGRLFGRGFGSGGDRYVRSFQGLGR